MLINHLAVVVPTRKLTGDDQTLRETVWQQTTGLLLPQLGKLYTRFQPASQAWKQNVGYPFGVVAGRSDPALFLYFYAAAKAYQEGAIRFHMEKFLDGVDIAAKQELPDISVYAVDIKNSAEAGAHMQWHLAMLVGELLPDCGLYFMAEKQAFADDALDQKILSDLKGYALCMVDLILEDRT